nr:hypothetical transcript [Hymenolepis microstoma]
MKAAKFQFTVSLEELTVNFEKGYRPMGVVIVFTRRGRRCTSKAVDLHKSETNESSLSYTWTLPDNLEVITTLYRNENSIAFDDKEWTFQVEDVGVSAEDFKEVHPNTTIRRRVLATRNLNLAEFASALPTQNNLKVNLRAASKKVSSATLFFTLHGLMLRSGEATDEDMISLASSMSLTYAPSSAYGMMGSSRFGSDSPIPEAANSPTDDFTSITHQLQALERCPDLQEVNDKNEEDEHPIENETKDVQNSQAKSTDDLQNSSALQNSQTENQTKVTSQTGQDLLTWCQEVTAGYPGVKIKDLTICFRSGLSLCAIIHHFQPEAIGDFEAVRALSPTERVRLAFDAAGRLGVARVFVDPCEVTRGRGGAPDRLSMMTYLHQLRTVLTAAAFAKESAEISERANAGGEVNNRSLDVNNEGHEKDGEGSKDSTKKSKGKKTKQRFNSGSGSASERYEQLLNKARNLLESTKTSDKTDSSMTSANADANGESSAKPTEKKEAESDHSTTGNLKTRRLKISNLKLFSDGMETHLTPENSPRKSSSTSASSMHSPRSLISSEAAAVAAEQEALDREAPTLEHRLRATMGTGSPEEEVLMRRWFQLVSRRNALVHRAYQLSIMEKESDLERTTALLNAELNELMAKDDSQKTAEDRAREELLLREVVEVVNERNEIVQELDYQEQAWFPVGLHDPETINENLHSKQLVSVVGNSVHWNSSHTFQCKVRVDPDTNILESCKLKISVRMESEGGKSFHKIGYVIVDLSCFVASGYVRCRRRYLLNGYDGNRRRAGKRQDNSLLVVSFTCQQNFGSTCFRLPQEDMSNCVSTSRSFDALESKATPSKVEAVTATTITTVPSNTPSALPSGLSSTTRLIAASASPDLSYVPSTTSFPALLPGGWNEDRVQMCSRRRRRDQEDEMEGATEKTVIADDFFDGRESVDPASRHHTDVDSTSVPRSTRFLLSSDSLGDDQVSSSGGEYISPASASFEHEEECEEIFASPMPIQLPSTASLRPTPMRISQRNLESPSSSASSTSQTSTSSTSSPSSPTSNGNSPMKQPPLILLQPSTHTPDFSSLPIPTRIPGPSMVGGRNEGENLVSGGSGQFHTCPHIRPASLLSSQQRKKLLGVGADSGFHFQGGGGGTSLGGEGTGTGTDLSLSAAVAAMERCSLASSGFQSHSRNSSFESDGMSRCFPSELIPATTPTGKTDYGGMGGSKQRFIDSTRAPHDEVVSQILRTSSAALTAARRSSSPRSSATVVETNPNR